jgi:HEAT repeat protein
MQQSRLFHSLLLVIVLAGAACAGGDKVTPRASAAATINDEAQNQSPATTIQSFTAVEGADLAARLEAARSRAPSSQTPYWSAYAFDVRPGVAIDPEIHEFHGSMNTIGDTSVFVGTTAGGMTVETRNLAIFLLRDGSGQVTRLEVYNLERKREYASYPVYWLGRSNNEESINYLKTLADAAPLNLLSEHAVLAISLHDDARVAPLLKNYIRNSPNSRVRSSAVYWLGQIGGEQAFLADIVRSDTEDKQLRRQAARAIGESRDRNALATLQGLYEAVKDTEVRRSIVGGASDNQDQDGAFAFLIKVATNEPDKDVRRTAVRQLGHFERESAVDELMKIYGRDNDVDIRRAVIQSLSETKSAKGQARLMEIARNDANLDLRRHAVRRISERGAPMVAELIKFYDSEQIPDMKRTILQVLSEIKSPSVEDKLFDVAKNDPNPDLRRQAIRQLGERAGSRSLEFLSATAQSPDGNTEVQMQAVRAISERKAEESIPILIKIAKTHPNLLVRKQAIRSLGESGDPRAVEYFREVLTTSK